LSNKTVLAVAAHPDDEVLGCGGTLAKLASSGHQVYTLILGSGIAARYDTSKSPQDKEVSALLADSDRSNKLLGVKKVFRHHFPDNRFDTVALLDIVKVIETVKQTIRPSMVFTHHAADVNIDHRRTFEAVLSAFRPQPGELPVRLLSFYVLSSTDWQTPSFGTFAPNVFIDIEKTLEKKVKAMKAYRTEVRPYPHPRSIEGIRIEAQRTGLRVGRRAAEAFELQREVLL
jgi:LmbE family N-acetylglucosaminyl deacetylase